MNIEMKTIIQVFTHICINMPQDDINNFWGLGDMIKGTIFLHDYCKKNGYEFIVDVQLHSLSKYLINNNHRYSNLILNNKDNIYFVDGGNIDNYIKNSNESVLYFFVNYNYGIENIDEECILFMNNLLELNDNYKDYVNDIILKYNNYNIIHFRLGDNDIVRQNNNLDYNFFMKKLLTIEFNKNDILISDSYEFKNYIKKNNIEITVLDTNPKHVGIKNDLIDTIIEMYLFKNTNKIKTYSIYEWVSGFSKYLSLIFNKKCEIIL